MPDRRPAVIAGLALALGAAPALQLASLAGLRVLNFAPEHAWNYVAYVLAAPYVGALLWRRHPRARFAAYVFLTHETVRGLHFRHWDAVAVALAWIALLQLPAARRYAPPVRPAEVRARLRRLAGRLPGGPGGQHGRDGDHDQRPRPHARHRPHSVRSLDAPAGRRLRSRR